MGGIPILEMTDDEYVLFSLWRALAPKEITDLDARAEWAWKQVKDGQGSNEGEAAPKPQGT